MENGRFEKYQTILKEKFVQSEVNGADLHLITRSNLHLSFGIKNFRDRVDLEAHFQNLKALVVALL